MQTEQLIFMHIPKAAGQTMRSIIARQYPDHELFHVEGGVHRTRLRSLDHAARARIFIGHVPYGFHRHLGGTSAYVTVLREPVSRVLSLYRYIVTTPKHTLHDQVLDRGLVEFVSGQVDAEEIENGQTRQIAGIAGGPVDASSLARAEQNLAEDFAAIGLAERFDESVMLFKKRLGWKVPFYVRKNVTQGVRVEVTTEAREIIRDRNALDLELYQFARQVFQENIRREGSLFHMEVSAFQALNAAAGVYRDVRELARYVGSRSDGTRSSARLRSGRAGSNQTSGDAQQRDHLRG